MQQIRNCTNLVHRLIHREHQVINLGITGSGIGRGQGLVLRTLAENDGLTQTEIAEKLDIRPSSLGELVMKLEENGFVERRQNENDKRVINVYLTEKGRELEKEFMNLRQQSAESWCAGLSENEKALLSELLAKLIASMEEPLSKNLDGFSGREIPFGLERMEMDRDDLLLHGPHSQDDDIGKRRGGRNREDWKNRF